MATTDERDGPDAPRLHPPTLGTLVAVPDAVALEGDDDLDEVAIRDLTADELVWTGRRRFGASLLSGVTARSWAAPGASVVGSVVERLEVVALSAPESGWWNVEVQQSRIGSAELYDSNWRGVRFNRCKLGYLNLRGAHLTDVVFADCQITDLDLGHATASRLAFPGTRVDRLDCSGSRLADVDLRGARLADIGDIEGLRGASISLEQLLDLAPALAQRLGIRLD